MKTDERNKFAIKSFLGEYLDLKKDKDNELATVDSIRKGVEFKGANLWILIFAIKMAKIRIHKLAPLNSTPFRIESTVSISLSLSFFKSRYSPRNDLIANLFRSSAFIVISFL